VTEKRLTIQVQDLSPDRAHPPFREAGPWQPYNLHAFVLEDLGEAARDLGVTVAEKEAGSDLAAL
jgi:hypothetical protein